jgi:hypothetical protein
MSENKQIEEMVRDMCDSCREATTAEKCQLDCCDGVRQHAEALYARGYRKQSEVIRCKDCEYFKEYTDEYKRDFKYKTGMADGDCHIRLMNTYLGNSQYCACRYDDFCSFAKAKGGEEK